MMPRGKVQLYRFKSDACPTLRQGEQTRAFEAVDELTPKVEMLYEQLGMGIVNRRGKLCVPAEFAGQGKKLPIEEYADLAKSFSKLEEAVNDIAYFEWLSSQQGMIGRSLIKNKRKYKPAEGVKGDNALVARVYDERSQDTVSYRGNTGEARAREAAGRAARTRMLQQQEERRSAAAGRLAEQTARQQRELEARPSDAARPVLEELDQLLKEDETDKVILDGATNARALALINQIQEFERSERRSYGVRTLKRDLEEAKAKLDANQAVPEGEREATQGVVQGFLAGLGQLLFGADENDPNNEDTPLQGGDVIQALCPATMPFDDNYENSHVNSSLNEKVKDLLSKWQLMKVTSDAPVVRTPDTVCARADAANSLEAFLKKSGGENSKILDLIKEKARVDFPWCPAPDRHADGRREGSHANVKYFWVPKKASTVPPLYRPYKINVTMTNYVQNGNPEENTKLKDAIDAAKGIKFADPSTGFTKRMVTDQYIKLVRAMRRSIANDQMPYKQLQGKFDGDGARARP